MTPINQTVLLNWLMNESRKNTWVKNKSSGSVYKVVNFNPQIHSKPSTDEIKKTEKSYSDISDFRNSEFGKSKEGQTVANLMSSFLDKGKVTFENKKILEKHIVTFPGDPSKWAVVDSKGKPVARLPDGIFDHIIQSEASNRSEGFAKKMKAAQTKQKNEGLAAELACTNYLKECSTNPSKLDGAWRDSLESIGLNTNKPFSVKQTGADAVVGVNPITGEKSSGTSKADIIIEQNGKVYNLSVKYSGGSPPSFGQWHTKNISAYLKGPLKVKDHKSVDEFIASLDRLRDRKYKGKDKKEQVARDYETASKFLKTPHGKQFILDVMSKTTQGCSLPKESRATHMMNINKNGGVDMYSVEEYLSILQDSGAGTFGCGVILSNTSSSQQRQTLFKPGAVSENINFKAVDWFKLFGEEGYSGRKSK